MFDRLLILTALNPRVNSMVLQAQKAMFTEFHAFLYTVLGF